jgi:hypothetical protein
MNKLKESHEAYQQQRAQDKYDGKIEGVFTLAEFRKCADYLASVLATAPFDEEDVGDLVRAALIMRYKRRGQAPKDEAIGAQIWLTGAS